MMKNSSNSNASLGLRDIYSERIRRSFFTFVRAFWPIVIAEKPVYNWHIPFLCGQLEEIALGVKYRQPATYPYTLINIPPGTSKSTICSVMYPAWVWTLDPTQRFICASYAQSIALDLAEKCRSIIQSDLYRELYPHVRLLKTTEAKSHFKNSYGGERYTTSTGSAITGVHAHQIIVDDPMNPRQAASEVERIEATRWLSHTLSTRKVDKRVTPTILIMQRLHEADPAGYLMHRRRDGLQHICLPGEDTPAVSPAKVVKYYSNGLLDPKRMDMLVLRDMQADLGSYAYAGQILQRPAPDEGGIFKREWFGTFQLDALPRDVVWHFICDPAYTSKEENDPSGMLAYAFHEGCWYVRDYQNVRLEFPDLLRALPLFCQRNGYSSRSRIAVEPKASGKSLVQTLRRETSLNIVEDAPPSHDKAARARDIAPALESGRVRLLADAAWTYSFVESLTAFPNARHDEEADCLVMMVNRHQQVRKLLHFGGV